jgi:hypothetical protein
MPDDQVTCRVCGCQEADACAGSCRWAIPPDARGLGLCDSCELFATQLACLLGEYLEVAGPMRARLQRRRGVTVETLARDAAPAVAEALRVLVDELARSAPLSPSVEKRTRVKTQPSTPRASASTGSGE